MPDLSPLTVADMAFQRKMGHTASFNTIHDCDTLSNRSGWGEE